MVFSILAAFLFALSTLFGSQSAHIFGASNANLGRALAAMVCLSVWAFTFGKGLDGAGLYWLIFSGCIGFGLGDMAFFAALPRIGPRLSLLLTQCLAGPIAGFAEWAWLGQKIQPLEIVCGLLILTGVAAALQPRKDVVVNAFFRGGVGFGMLAALGQGLGAVVSRQANAVNLAAGTQIDGGTAAFQRMLGGFFLTFLLVLSLRQRSQTSFLAPGTFRLRAGWHFLLLNGLVGPALGVGFYQLALLTTPSALVLAIVATSPVIVMLLQYFNGGERPGAVSILGALLAVGGAVWLAMVRN